VGGFYVSLPRDVLDELRALRGPGRSYSEGILRVAKGDAAGDPRAHPYFYP